MNKKRIKPRVYNLLLLALVCVALASCGNTQSTGDIIDDFVQEVNNGKDYGKNFKAFNTPGYFAICHYIKNIPENKAKLLILGSQQDLKFHFKERVLEKLEKGEILTQILKEKKGLAYAVCCEDLEFHVYFTPEEIFNKYYK